MYKYLFNDKKGLIRVLLINFVSTIMMTGMALIYGNLVNVVSQGADGRELAVQIAIAFVYSLAASVLMIAATYYQGKFMNGLRVDMQGDYYKKLLKRKYSFISQNDSAKYIANITNDVNRVRWNYHFGFISMFSTGTKIVFSFVSACILEYRVALVMSGLVLLMAVIPVFFQGKINKRNNDITTEYRNFTATLKENLLGIDIIKNYSAEELSYTHFEDSNKNLVRKENKLHFTTSVAGGLGNMVMNLAIITLVGLTCYFVMIEEVKIGAVLSIVNIGMGFYAGVLEFANTFTWMMGVKGVRKALWEIMGVDEEQTDRKIEFKESIALDNVIFRYPDTDRTILNGISYTFEKNKKYLILGKSGSGKSTVLKLITRMYEPDGGCIRLDGKEYGQFSEKEIVRIVALAQQECYLFTRSFRRNIDLLEENDDAKLNSVIGKACLEDFVGLLADGVDTVIDEEVNQVSGGEKLRINLARALYRGGDVLLLDEVTSALDKSTSFIVEDNILALKDKTVINVSHKFNDSTLSKYDGILIIENGEIVLAGDYASLEGNPILERYRHKQEN